MTIAELLTAGLLAVTGASMVSIAFSLVNGHRRLGRRSDRSGEPPRRGINSPMQAAAYLAREFDRR